jgi:hypothetical protein
VKLIFPNQHTGTILKYYNGNLGNALVDVFPDIGLERSKLQLSVMGKKSLKSTYG